MRVRHLAVPGVAAAVATAALAGTVGASPARHDARLDQSITVWLQVDAQKSWPATVDAATAAFQQQHPGVTVNVEYQQWSDHLTKLDAVLAGGGAPDVIELGNSETTKYMASGAFQPLKAADYPNSGTWLKGLTDSCRFGGKLYCVPYYAGARAVIYRQDLYRKAGVTSTPTSLDEFVAASTKVMSANSKDTRFSALYFPGKYWYAAMSFVYDYGGKIALQKDGKWQGALTSPQSQTALTKLKTIVGTLSKADKTGDEAKQDQAFAQGHIGAVVANGWEWGVITDKKAGNPKLADKLGAFPMPSHKKGRYMPTFLGGSDLAIPYSSKNAALAADWIKAFTSTASERQLATVGKVIPNTTTLVNINQKNPQLAPFAAAAKSSWFVPTAPNWASVESANVLPDMLVSIFTGRKTVADATKAASGKITQLLNQAS